MRPKPAPLRAVALQAEGLLFADRKRSAGSGPRSGRQPEDRDLSLEFGRSAGSVRREIGRGTQAVIYRLPDGRIEKAFHDDVPDDLIERERRNARLAYEAGVPTWRVDGPTAVSAGRSVVGSFEAGRPLSRILRWRPHRALPLIRRMARLHAQIHATPPDTTFDKKSVSAEGALRRLRRLAPEADFDRVPQLIGASESGFCHGDLSPSNVLWDGERMLALDWARSGFGALTADAGRTAAIIFASRRIGTPAPAPMGRAYRRLLATEYMAAYCAETGRSLDEVRAWAAVFLESKATSGPDVGRRAGLVAEVVHLVQPAAAER